MTTTEQQLCPITDDQVDVINQARSVLDTIADDAMRQAWNAPTDATSSSPRAQSLGRLAGIASVAADNLFDVLNSAASYGVAELTEEQLHNRRDGEVA